jgi:hypothetical protein
LFKFKSEYFDTGEQFGIILVKATEQNAYSPATVSLLRTRRDRPCRGCAAEQRDERAPVHCPVPPRYGGRLLRCGISTRLMTAMGHVWTAPD